MILQRYTIDVAAADLVFDVADLGISLEDLAAMVPEMTVSGSNARVPLDRLPLILEVPI